MKGFAWELALARWADMDKREEEWLDKEWRLSEAQAELAAAVWLRRRNQIVVPTPQPQPTVDRTPTRLQRVRSYLRRLFRRP